MAVKPWVGDLKASIPQDFKLAKGMELAPDNSLSIKHVFGCRSFDSRNMAKLVKEKNKVVFCTAALGVLMDCDANTQSFF